jgi:hypothetical protein
MFVFSFQDFYVSWNGPPLQRGAGSYCYWSLPTLLGITTANHRRSGKFLLVFTSTVILGSESRGTHDAVLLTYDFGSSAPLCRWERIIFFYFHNIIMRRGDYRRVLDWMIGFMYTLYTVLGTTGNLSTVADLHTFQFTVTHLLGFSVFTSRILATDFITVSL